LDFDSGLTVPSPVQAEIYDETGAKNPRKRALSQNFFRAFEIYRNNPTMILPSLIPVVALILGFVIFAGFIGFTALFFRDGFVALSAMGGFLLFIIISIALFFMAQGVTIEMVREAYLGNKADLSESWNVSKSKMGPLILSSLLAGIIIALGYMLFIIPGIILSFAFYFVAQVVMIEGKSGSLALRESYGFVRANLTDAAIITLSSLVISIVLHMIPFIGALLGLLSLPYIFALATVLYLDTKEVPLAKPETRVNIS
jgi:hypothetical protein